jgi:hypothetical protein
MHLTPPSTDTGAVAPPYYIDLSPDPLSPDRDRRIAGALRIRIERIGEEIAVLEEIRDRLSDALRVVERRGRWGRA